MLGGGVPVCHVKSWLSGRLVSLPFSDHCEPLVDQPDQLSEILSYLKQGVSAHTWRYAELRPRVAALSDQVPPTESYWLHRLDLSPTRAELFDGFHPSCVQRAIRRARREELSYEIGSSASLVTSFYRLLRLTRRRHGLPPQPLAWFQNLVVCLGDRLTIRVASKAGRPIAGLLTLSFKKTIVYKYGGSDARYHKLGGMPFLFWKLIQEAKAEGFEELDLGRSDLNQYGLTTFKDRLGACRSKLTYFRYPAVARRPKAWKQRVARRAFELLPDPALALAGRLLYRHYG
jgi:lipid II:glycine glycyltransferase (peptidoglycan interpeptide bridge formation enzyme)